jgi:CheY-like chemotaxis protein
MEDKRKILLIDDDPSLLVTVGDFLEFEGYEVVKAGTGEKALKQLKRFQPDLVILDISMPGMGGVGFLRRISSPAGSPRYPVLVLTARANMAEFFSDVEVDGFVTKPCNPDELLKEISKILFLRQSETGSGNGDDDDHGRKVLIGEDDDNLLVRIADYFAGNGYSVTTAKKGPEAIEKAVAERPDIMVVKRIFAGMNGNMVARMLQQMPNTRRIPVVLYDESVAKKSESDFLEQGSGVTKYLKTSEPSELYSAAETVL